jgi:hypothetical protein
VTSTRLSSSSLSCIAYAADLRLLRIEFASGEIYYYSGVPEATYAHLVQAESKGQYFNKMIRNRFPYEKASGTQN